MIHSVTLQKLTAAPSTSGGPISTWADRTVGVACLISQVAGKGVNQATMSVRFNTQATAAAQVGVGDRLLVTRGPSLLVGEYLAIESIDEHGQWQLIQELTKVNCRLVSESWQPQ